MAADVVEIAKKFEHFPKLLLSALPAGSIISVATQHSLYTLRLLDPEKCVVEASGGYFTQRAIDPCITTVIGSSLGGSMIYKGYLIEGMYCEFDKNVITSTIVKLSAAITN